jgi:hypothetical protein
MSVIRNSFEQHLKLNMFCEEDFEILGKYFKEKPSRVDFFVQKWRAGPTKREQGILYLAIIAGAPISECIKWGIDHDDFGDWDLSEMGYYYLNEDGSYTPMSWEDYDQWLAKQKEIEGDDPEF